MGSAAERLIRWVAPPTIVEVFDRGKPVDRVLNALASYDGASLTGAEIQQRTSLEPAQVVDALALLEFMGTVRCTYWSGSAPFDFSSVELTPDGRLQLDRPVGLSRAEQLEALKREMAGIWSRHGRDPFPRFAKILRGSSLSAEEVSKLLDLVPSIRTGTTGDNCRRLHSIVSRVYEERRGDSPRDAPLPSFWKAHALQIAVGIIATVVGGLILAALL